MNAEQLVKYAARKVEKLWKRQGEIHAMYHYVTRSGEHRVFVAPPFVKADDKNLVVAMAKSIFELEDAVAYVFVVEAWIHREEGLNRGKQVDELLDKFGGTLANVPGRREQIILMGEDENGMVYGRMEINRPAGRESYLSLLKMDRPDDMEGRMVGLLPVRGVKQ
jgi:hypothetical protein